MTDYRKQLEAIGGYENELLPVPAGGVRKIIDDLEKAQQQLAAEQAYSAKLLGELESTRNGLIWWMDAFPLHVTEADHEEMAKLDQALALPHDDTALREWGARLLDWTFSKGMGGTLLLDTAMQLRSGDWKP